METNSTPMVASGGTATVDAHQPELCFAVTVTRSGADWKVTPIDGCYDRVNSAIAAARQEQAHGPVFVMLCVDDEYFIIVRPRENNVDLLISDATMAIEDELASSALAALGAQLPDQVDADIDVLDAWAEGNFDILADLGMSEQVMSVICKDSELWASEQLLRVAAELGFESELAQAADLDLD